MQPSSSLPSHWGEQIFRGYTLVRFLHLHDSPSTTLVARVPLRTVDDDLSASSDDSDISKQIASEVSTMQYVESHTNILVLHVHHHHSTHGEGDVRSPYILMSCPKSKAWRSVRYGTTWTTKNAAPFCGRSLTSSSTSGRFDKEGSLFNEPALGKGKTLGTSNLPQ